MKRLIALTTRLSLAGMLLALPAAQALRNPSRLPILEEEAK